MQKKRIVGIDLMKTIAIISVVLGHSLNGQGIWEFLYSFHVPLFIVISGMNYYKSDEKFVVFIWRKIRSILIPYYCFSIISIVIYMMIGSKLDYENILSLAECMKGLLWANGETGIMRWNLPLWYLPMFFALQIMAFFFYNNIEKGVLRKVITSLLVAIFLYKGKYVTNLPFGIETAIYLFPFFGIGILYKSNLEKIKKLEIKKSIPLIFAMCFLAFIIAKYQDNVDYVMDQYRIYPLFFVAASFIISSIVICAVKVEREYKLIKIISKNSLPILLMHKFPLMFFQFFCPILKDLYNTNRQFAAIIISGISIVACLFVATIVEKIAPWIIGKYKYS